MDKSRKELLLALGILVKKQRTQLNLSQEEFGFRANLDRTYISGVERGVRNPSLTALVCLASGLSITVSELLTHLEIEAKKLSD